MQRGGGGRDDFFDFGDPFAGFGGFGGHRSLMSSVFGGRDPFDDPFFTRPFGSMFGPSMFGPSMFGPSGSPFGNLPASGFLEHEAPQANTSKGPIIQEITSEDEGEEGAKGNGYNPRKHSRSSKEPYVQDPDDEAEERKSKQLQYRNDYNRTSMTQPQARSFSFQSSTVTYGGADGAYYSSSTTRRSGSDGVTLEENKEADTTTGRASHRISRGIHNKGHSVTRKLNPDGKVNTMQTLHNLNQDELPVFEETWKGNARKHLPGWNEGFNVHGNIRAGSSGQNGQGARGGWALPSTEQPRNPQRMGSDGEVRPNNTSKGKARAFTRINID